MTVTCASQIPSAAGLRLRRSGRALLLWAVALVAACKAGPEMSLDTQPSSEGNLSISLVRETMDARPVLAVTITNVSGNPICMLADALQNPNSGEMHLRLRDSRGRPLAFYPRGFVPPPLEGVVRIDQHASVTGRYYLDTRFRRINSDRPFPAGLSARASFLYDYCDNTWTLRAMSAWQAI